MPDLLFEYESIRVFYHCHCTLYSELLCTQIVHCVRSLLSIILRQERGSTNEAFLTIEVRLKLELSSSLIKVQRFNLCEDLKASVDVAVRLSG